MPECKESYKKSKESKPKESEIKETKPYTKYDKPIGPVKPKETKPYTKYDKPIDIRMYVHTCYVLIKPPIPYITSSPLCSLRVFTS